MSDIEKIIEELKRIHKTLHAIHIGQDVFIVRTITRGEYQSLLNQGFSNTDDFQERLCALATVYPENYDFAVTGKAGVVSPLGEKILVTSGLFHISQQVEMLDMYRQEMNLFDRQAEAVISLVFQGIREEEMLGWTQDEFMRMLAKAEWTMQTIWGMDFEFQTKQLEEEEESSDSVEESEADQISRTGMTMRFDGLDPMIELRDYILTGDANKKVDFPVIGGPRLFKNEEVMELVREQIQRLPK